MGARDTPGASVLSSQPHELAELELEVAQLKVALRNRERIGTAKGILMAQSHLTQDEAFACLVRASQRSNKKLTLICEDLVEAVDAMNRTRSAAEAIPPEAVTAAE